MAKSYVQEVTAENASVVSEAQKVSRNRDTTLRGTRGDINKDVAQMFAAREARNPSVEHNHMVEAAYRWFLELQDVDTIKRLLKEVKENRVKAAEGSISI